eukprot:11179140-Lingulodinium_polyedra.AAC.1
MIKPWAAEVVPSIPANGQNKVARVFTTSIVKHEEANTGNAAPVNVKCFASNPENEGNKCFVNAIQGIEEECEQGE